ncbi:MAG: OmpA family protein [Acidobacteriota bacterium]
MNRIACSLVLASGLLVAATADAKPRKYSWELSPYVAARDYDSSLGLGTHGPRGVRLGYNFTDNWGVEVGGSYDGHVRSSVGGEADVEQLDINLLRNFNTGQGSHETHGRWFSWDRWVPYLTAGISHFSADTDLPGTTRDGRAANFGGGVRLMVSDIAGIRLDLRTTRSLDDDDFGGSFGNTEASVGASFILGGATPRDSDSDGVIDRYDKCPGTPLGCWVDEDGCQRDADGDTVCDGLDRCPNTLKACPVDSHGCPLDEDRDGVCDGLDDCPGTPAGSWVDERGCPRDPDGDGVHDGIDRCPRTPPECEVDRRGCPLDEDGDGVCDGIDRCPGTPAGTRVDDHGCAIEVVKLVLANVYFEFNKADIQPFYAAVLDEVAESLLANEWRRVQIELRGHTDAIDDVDYNYRLGSERAANVKDYLVRRGVSPNRLETKSYSELSPASSNDSDRGRALNRRVEMVPTTGVDADRVRQVRVLARDILFRDGTADLNADGQQYLQEIAGAFTGDQFDDLQFVVTGHGSPGLASQRANAVADYLGSFGISRGRMVVTSGSRRGARVDVQPQSR